MEGLSWWLNGKESTCNAEAIQKLQELQVQSLGRENALEEGMQSILVFLPGEFHGQLNQEGNSLSGHKESNMIEVT